MRPTYVRRTTENSCPDEKRQINTRPPQRTPPRGVPKLRALLVPPQHRLQLLARPQDPGFDEIRVSHGVMEIEGQTNLPGKLQGNISSEYTDKNDNIVRFGKAKVMVL